MQFIKCTREALLKPLQTVGGIVEGRQTLPILANILLKKTGESVCFSTTDLEIQIRTTAPVGVGEEEVSTTLPAAKLIALLTALPSQGTEVSLETVENKVVLRAGKSRYTLAPLDAANYPELPPAQASVEVTIPSQTLKHLMQMVHFAMAQQDVRYYLNGMLLVVESGRVRAVATDGHRLALCDAECDLQLEEPFQVILPRKSIHQLLKLLPDTDAPVLVKLGTQQARFHFGDIEFQTKVVEGRFPDYNRVIPKNNDKIFLVNREELIGSLKRAAILANEKFKGLRWIVSEDKLQIQSTNSDMEEAVEEILIDYKGENLDLGFNVLYLLDVLGNLKNSEVRFSFSSSQGATLLTMPESNQFCYVLMPMRI
ncbi:MAG: DNA polymerase III subunit beta [Duodenibacillus sp.]